ncbi:Hypothetical predicted protein, partial [Xyrichtys novacula]
QMLDMGMLVTQSGLALGCCRHKEKRRVRKIEVNPGDDRGAKGKRQVRREAGEGKRK